MGYYNKIIGGIILIVWGIFVTGLSAHTYIKSQTVLEYCESISRFREFHLLNAIMLLQLIQ